MSGIDSSARPAAAGSGFALVGAGLRQLPSWPLRRWLVALAAAAAVALAIGVPTDIVPTPLFRRMTPVVWWDYPVMVATALLFGLLAATYIARRPRERRARTGFAFGTGFVSLLAVGCPICNKLVVLALGVSGAFTYFAPIQPILGVGSVALLAVALAVRLRGLAACPVAPAGTR